MGNLKQYMDGIKHTTPEESFELGVEWASVRALLEIDPNQRIDVDINPKNRYRVTLLCEELHRTVSSYQFHNGLVNLVIQPARHFELRLIG
jgi:hypothetical protein